MNSAILRTASRYLLPVLLVFSVFILLRGHYSPGGGFVGGLVASIAFVLHGFTRGTEKTLTLLSYHPGVLIPIGLAIAALSTVLPLFFGLPVMTGVWGEDPVPGIGLLGTALFFDIGVYLVVIGITLTILFTIAQNVD